LKKKTGIQGSKKINAEILETVVAEAISEEKTESEPVGKTNLEERQDLWNKIQKFDPEASAMDYYDNGGWDLEKMSSDLKVLLEKERFGK
jgi:hypothetical protein